MNFPADLLGEAHGILGRVQVPQLDQGPPKPRKKKKAKTNTKRARAQKLEASERLIV